MGEGMFSSLYRWLYEATLGMPLTEWLRADFAREPMYYLIAVLIAGIWVEVPRSFKWGATGLLVLAWLIGHVLTVR